MFSSSDWDCIDWDWFDKLRGSLSWISEIQEMVAHIHSSRSWQATEGNNVTAMTEDGERPEEKPRPPAGGQISFQFKPELVPILVAVKLNRAMPSVRNS